MLDARHIKLREGLPRFAAKLLRGEPTAVAYLGGSITEGAGASLRDETSWRALNEQFLAEHYAGAEFTFINAGVGGTTSTFGAHRLQAHALSQAAVDLLFVEFSVNDGEDREESIRGMEGIVRQSRRLSPQTELCFLYTAADKNLSDELPFNIAVHEEVAAHYGIASVNLAGGVQDLINAGQAVWEALAPDRVHPNDEGHALYAAYVNAFLVQAVDAVAHAVEEDENRTDSADPSEISSASVVPASATAATAATAAASDASEAESTTKEAVQASLSDSHSALSLPIPLDERNYEFAALVELDAVIATSGFVPARLNPDDPLINWRFDTDHLAAEGSHGEQLVFAVEGRRAGLVLLHGPDSGILEYSLDGAESFTPVDVFDEWCPLAYRPILVLFPLQPERKIQEVTIRCTGTKDERSQGTGIRVMKLLRS